MTSQDLTLLSFKIGEDIFAVDALQVNHILEVPSTITAVPNTPVFMLGIINLHGNIVPVVDMRILMGNEKTINGADTSIIVINPNAEQESRLGLLVDMVKEVIETNQSELTETVTDGKKGLIDTFEGTLCINEEFIHVIDIKNIMEVIEK
ncbi:chemotaxis protein CheW [Alkaliflexus imshenetskii]|uniref:chemotaxis protein CheW n=1 Tax=Alkaliflexus imshenetskii TaxID=286730 RepID=UPI0004B13180|nr:chemotaxis protein CheW [Alkaliflexus imshenetskii]